MVTLVGLSKLCKYRWFYREFIVCARQGSKLPTPTGSFQQFLKGHIETGRLPLLGDPTPRPEFDKCCLEETTYLAVSLFPFGSLI